MVMRLGSGAARVAAVASAAGAQQRPGSSWQAVQPGGAAEPGRAAEPGGAVHSGPPRLAAVRTGLCLGVLKVVGGGAGGVGSAGGCGPDHGAGVRLPGCPSWRLFAPVVAPAQRPDIAFAAAAACVVGDRVVEIAPCRGAPAAGGAAGHGAGRDQMPQSRAERVARFLVAVITGPRGQRRDRYAQPLDERPGLGIEGVTR